MSATEHTPLGSGYTPCACRDCFDIAVSSDVGRPELCGDCEAAGCEADDGECSRDDAYGVGEDAVDPDPLMTAKMDRLRRGITDPRVGR